MSADFHAFIESFAHVVDRQRGGRNGDQRFHLDPGLGGRRDAERISTPFFA